MNATRPQCFFVFLKIEAKEMMPISDSFAIQRALTWTQPQLFAPRPPPDAYCRPVIRTRPVSGQRNTVFHELITYLDAMTKEWCSSKVVMMRMRMRMMIMMAVVVMMTLIRVSDRVSRSLCTQR